MKLVCKYCGHVIEYENGRGWFPGYVTKMYNHIFGKHVKMEQLEDQISDTITYQAYIDPGYSFVLDENGNVDSFVLDENGNVVDVSLTVTQEDRLHPPAYSTPTEATVKSDA